MWIFFRDKKWFLWSLIVTILILSSSWIQVQIDVKINEWFGSFYDLIQKALKQSNSVSLTDFNNYLLSFATLAGIYVFIALISNFVISHWLFRWRKSMVEYYKHVS
jgi:peptide/bleomycin uptake transporter